MNWLDSRSYQRGYRFGYDIIGPGLLLGIVAALFYGIWQIVSCVIDVLLFIYV